MNFGWVPPPLLSTERNYQKGYGPTNSWSADKPVGGQGGGGAPGFIIVVFLYIKKNGTLVFKLCANQKLFHFKHKIFGGMVGYGGSHMN